MNMPVWVNAEPVVVQGGWYSYACPNGQRVTLKTNDELIYHGPDTNVTIPLPPGGNLLQLVMPCDGTQRIAGTGHLDDHVWEWVGHPTSGEWLDRGLAFGTRANIYDVRNVLLTVRGPGEPSGALGFRYVGDDGAVVLSVATYADPQRHIFEYTSRRCNGVDLVVGQGGDEEGLQALVDGRRVLVDEGQNRFINFECEGETVALSWVRERKGEGVTFLTTVSFLASLPTYELPDEPPPPPPPQNKCPEFKAPVSDKRLDVVEGVKHDYPQLKGGEIVDQVAHRLNRIYKLDPIRFGRKARNADGGNPNDDVLTFRCDVSDRSKKKLIDLLIDGGGQDRPTWDLRPESEEAGNGFWTKPVADDLDDDPPPPDGDLAQRVEQLEAELRFQAGVVAKLLEGLQQIDERVNRLENAPPSGVPVEKVLELIEAAFKNSKIDCTVGRSWGHSHSCSGVIVR